MKKRGTAAWLALAARHRQWQVEEGMPEVRASAAAECQADAAQVDAQTVLASAHAARGAALAATFDADALMRYALYAARLHEALADARAQADAARETSERLRMQARGLLAERDAYRQRLERSMDEVDVEAKRRAARDHDELWLLRGGSAAGGSRQ